MATFAGGNDDIAVEVLARVYNMTMTERWSTTACQCGGYESCFNDWCLALMFPPLAMGCARQEADGTNCCYATLTTLPAGNYNVVRRRYEIIGDDCGDDCLLGTFCMPCAARRALTETKKRGRVRNWGPFKWEAHTQNQGMFKLPLCACTFETFCYALLAPFCLSGQARSRFDGSSCCFNMVCTTPCGNYTMIREGYGIDGHECTDLLIASLMYPCALQRMYVEATFMFLKAMAEMAAEKAKGCCPCCKK